MEMCPGSTARLFAAPFQRYKQPKGWALSPVRRRTRRATMAALGARAGLDAVR